MTREEWAAYHRQLRRVYRTRGKASAHLCADECGRQATDWAHIHTESGEDPWADFLPLSGHCHARYDRIGWWGPHDNGGRKNWTHCRHGHEFTEVNTYVRPDGRRKCRACNREGMAAGGRWRVG